ncbi:hypothetical protein Tdes44962_MAKER02757 [Teratosphaeria destructans]|uniref:Uncharacterized protein n=1 Tax=Teratosphaeria destructans TaxID=418781 RepID=A0A9W7SSI5_9PEZI|nr:hypothetical protein Tdes44962_MAKER02757 [Teratosphaeria destructans]
MEVTVESGSVVMAKPWKGTPAEKRSERITIYRVAQHDLTTGPLISLVTSCQAIWTDHLKMSTIE